MNTLTLGKKITLGFSALLLIILILGGISVWIMRSTSGAAKILAEEYAQELSIVSDLSSQLANAKLSFRTYTFTADSADAQAAREALLKVRKRASETKILADKSEHLPILRKEADVLIKHVDAYIDRLARCEKIQNELLAKRREMDESAKSFITNITDLVDNQSKELQEEINSHASATALLERRTKMQSAGAIRNTGNLLRIAAQKSIADRNSQELQKTTDHFDGITKNFDLITPLIHKAEDIEDLNKVKASVHQYQEALKAVATLLDANAKEMADRQALNKELSTITETIFAGAVTNTVKTAENSSTALSAGQRIQIIGILLALAVGIAFSVLLTRNITKAIQVIIERITAGSEQASAAASQVSSASQSLAEGASAQASSLEETSSSLEEMASMTARNAESAESAKKLAQDARHTAEKAAEDLSSMTAAVETVKHSSAQLSTAMDKIDASSQQITHIMKTIDEIAFQTNILSLNAAVEAARAGEAGAGFAVVADEVRTLAQRSAEAAKQTANMIRESSDSSHQGIVVAQKVETDLTAMTTTAQKVAENLQLILGKVKQVDGVISEISTACKEQEQGTVQLNTAVSQMDKVTQSTASSAEETASAAEELSAQSREALASVMELNIMVGGKAHHDSTTTASPSTSPTSTTHKVNVRSRIAPAPSASRRPESQSTATIRSEARDHDFRDM